MSHSASSSGVGVFLSLDGGQEGSPKVEMGSLKRVDSRFADFHHKKRIFEAH